MGQERLSALTLLSVEQEIADKINFDDVVDKFSAVKARKMNTLYRASILDILQFIVNPFLWFGFLLSIYV